MKLYLASTSKMKSDILNKVCLNHSCISIEGEEISKATNPAEYTMELARNKAYEASRKVETGIIIGLDTIVYRDGLIIEKPKSIEDARNNLSKSQNKTVQVITGISIIDIEKEKVITDHAISKVTLKEIDEIDIDYYMKSEKYVMHASGFVLENTASCFLDKIEGSFYNVLGCPVETIYYNLKKLGYHLEDFE
ncbi:MAG: Maf family nucleotide pyrophosphatase [Bacilli bacterium]